GDFHVTGVQTCALPILGGDRGALRRPGRGPLRHEGGAMIHLLEAVADGLGRGSVYALIGLGFVIIFKASGVISFAQPGFMIAGVVLVSYLVDAPWLGFWG